ncbi:MAG: hypothetical protein JO125_01370 [Chloroflexi bacterium]|nr:hypothetical protein [Ktedonobacteraceae bacterium]MBV9020052.1 hypothetical protein [Ktedonobacteraceae bacterium]MBV9706039.1 hypothetical protein [Chloroflexota bacterium]
MLSPSPTQPSSEPSKAEKKEINLSPAQRRLGQTPAALLIKAILRPIFKLIYYTIKGVRNHFWLTLLLLFLLIVSISLTSYVTTKQLPFGVGNDPFNFHVRGGDGGGDHVKNWLYALRDGNVTTMSLLQSELIMSQPPDPNQLVAQFSEPKAHVQWKSINVLSVSTESDTTVDSFVEIDFAGSGPGGNVKGIMIWHFTTLPQNQGRILYIDLVSARPALQ